MVYVDWLISDKILKSHKYCHLLADSRDELVGFGFLIGLKPHWLKCSRDFNVPHFTITRQAREKAVRLGAVELNCAQYTSVLKRLRNQP